MDLDDATQLKCRLSKAFASSKRANKRNLECPFYILFAIWLQTLVMGRPNLIVAPQYTLWFEGEFDVEGDAVAGQADNGGLGLVNEGDSILADMSTDSAISVHLQHALNKIPDFVILHIMALPLPDNEPRFDVLEGIWITGETCPLVMECKSFIEFKAENPTQAAIWLRLTVAHAQLRKSCLHAFGKYPGLARLVAIATAGPCWSYVFVERAQVATEAAWETLTWVGSEDPVPYFSMQFQPPDARTEEATMVIRNFLMQYAELAEPLPGVPPPA